MLINGKWGFCWNDSTRDSEGIRSGVTPGKFSEKYERRLLGKLAPERMSKVPEGANNVQVKDPSFSMPC
jgi:hypothetical protein